MKLISTKKLEQTGTVIKQKLFSSGKKTMTQVQYGPNIQNGQIGLGKKGQI